MIKITIYWIDVPHSSQNLAPSLFTKPQEHFPGWTSFSGFPNNITSPTFLILFHGILPSEPSFWVITKTIACVESIPTCFAIPTLFAFSSYTIRPSIEVTEVAGLGIVTVSCGGLSICEVFVTWGALSTWGVFSTCDGVPCSIGFAFPTPSVSSRFLDSLYSAI